MAGGSFIKIHYDKNTAIRSLKDVLKRIVEKATSSETKKAIASEYKLIVSKYVPYGKGKLRRNARVVAEGKDFAIRYSAKSKKGYDYADLQYQPEKYGRDESLWTRKTPGTYSHWNRHLTTAERQAFKEESERIIKENILHGR